MQLRFRAIREESPGKKWKAHFEATWPDYRDWFLREGEKKRPGYVTCRKALHDHMPEMVPLWEKLTELAGGGDQEARLLSLYCPTPYLSGCSQAVWTRGEPALIRNYDYHPDYCEGTVLFSAWHGTKVIAQTDCLWGVLDGINEKGLAVSLAFGGRQVVGEGFGIPLVLRYILEFVETTKDAREVLQRVPSHMAYNVSVVDAAGRYATAHLSPDRPTFFVESPVATNHQREIEWTRHAKATRSLEREEFLKDQLVNGSGEARDFLCRFIESPLYSKAFDKGHGTLYTAAYRPRERAVEYRWPNHAWQQSFESFDEGEVLIRYSNGDGE